MKVRKLKDGDLIEVGDRIKVEHMGFGTQWETVERVTPKFAFVRYNENAEGQYKRTYEDFGFCPKGSGKWRTTYYSAWRPVDSTPAASPPREEK